MKEWRRSELSQQEDLIEHKLARLRSATRKAPELFSEWELAFIESVNDFWNDRGFLTVKQLARVDFLYKQKGVITS